jgi:hypothetical protein
MEGGYGVAGELRMYGARVPVHHRTLSPCGAFLTFSGDDKLNHGSEGGGVFGMHMRVCARNLTTMTTCCQYGDESLLRDRHSTHKTWIQSLARVAHH